MKFFEGNAVWQLVKQSDAMTITVLSLLFVLSILCWAIFFGKLFRLRAKKRDLIRVLSSLNREAVTIDELVITASKLHDSGVGNFVVSNVRLVQLIENRPDEERIRSLQLVDNHLEQTLDDIIAKQESYLPFLSTTAAVSTLIGLFGTVWGLIHAFVRISERESADIITVAPGIAEALITTLAGLMVAIPALVMYNYLAVQVRDIQDVLTRIADRLMGIAKSRLSV